VEAMIGHVAAIVRTIVLSLESFVLHLVLQRRRRLARERRFYRHLNAYCRANDLSPILADDWKTLYSDRER
jgi:hypothetical protein